MLNITLSVKLNGDWLSVPVKDASYSCGLDTFQELSITCPGQCFDGIPTHIRIDGILCVAVQHFQRTNEIITVSGSTMDYEALAQTVYNPADLGSFSTVAGACSALASAAGIVITGASASAILQEGWQASTAQAMLEDLATAIDRKQLFFTSNMASDIVSFASPFTGGNAADIISHEEATDIPSFDSCVLTKVANIAQDKTLTLAPTSPTTNGEYSAENPPSLLCEKENEFKFYDRTYINGTPIVSYTQYLMPNEGDIKSIIYTQNYAPFFYKRTFTDYKLRDYGYSYEQTWLNNGYIRLHITFSFLITGYTVTPYSLYKPSSENRNVMFFGLLRGDTSGHNSDSIFVTDSDIDSHLQPLLGAIPPLFNANDSNSFAFLGGDGQTAIIKTKYIAKIEVLDASGVYLGYSALRVASMLEDFGVQSGVTNCIISGTASDAELTCEYTASTNANYGSITPDPSDMPYWYLYTNLGETPETQLREENVATQDNPQTNIFAVKENFSDTAANRFIQNTDGGIGVLINPYFNANQTYDANDPETHYNGIYKEQWTDQNRFVGTQETAQYDFSWVDIPDWSVPFTYDSLTMTNATYYASIIAIGMFGTQVIDLSSSNVVTSLAPAQGSTPMKVRAISPTSETKDASTTGGAKARPFSLQSGLWPNLPSDADAAAMLAFANIKNPSRIVTVTAPLECFASFADIFLFEFDGLRPYAFSFTLSAAEVQYSFAREVIV